MLADKAVHVARLTAEAVIGVGHDRFGGFKTFIRLEDIAESGGIHALYDARLEEGADLGAGVVVAAVDEVEAVNGADILARVGAMEHEEGVGAVGR